MARIDELSDEQETEIADTVQQLETGRVQIEQDVGARLEGLLSEDLDPRLEAAATALAGLGTQVTQLDSDAQARREELEPQLQEISGRIEPLQASVVQVRQAADQVGLQWP